MKLNRRVDNFFVDGQSFAHHIWGEHAVVSDDRHGTRVDLLAYAPNVQVGDTRICLVGSCFNDFTDFIDHRMIHLAVELNLTRIGNQTLGPNSDQHSTDDSHKRVQPRPAEYPATDQCRDGKH